MELVNFIFGNSRGEFPLSRDAEQYFEHFFDVCGLDGYGHCNMECPISSYLTPHGAIDTELFTIFPYYWGDDESLMALPNFVYKPEKIQIQWYKYPLRDAYSNVELDAEKIRVILEECEVWLHEKNLKHCNTD